MLRLFIDYIMQIPVLSIVDYVRWHRQTFCCLLINSKLKFKHYFCLGRISNYFMFDFTVIKPPELDRIISRIRSSTELSTVFPV